VPDLASVVAAAAISFGVALAVLYLSHRAGLTDIQASVSGAQRTLVETLKARVDNLEAENRRLKEDMDYLKRENEQLRVEVDRLRRYIIENKLGSADAGA
jgi:predicted RNase H-like nuclease (RuvC/YqgF family)